jgi:hypothetical protein
MSNQLTPDQLQALLTFASKKLGIPEQQLAKTVQTGQTDHLGLSEENQQKLNSVLGDKAQAEKLMSSPAVQSILETLLKQGE